MCTVILTSVCARSYRLSHCCVSYVTCALQLSGGSLPCSRALWGELSDRLVIFRHDDIGHKKLISFLSSEPEFPARVLSSSFSFEHHELTQRSVEKRLHLDSVQNKHTIAPLFTLNCVCHWAVFEPEAIRSQERSLGDFWKSRRA